MSTLEGGGRIITNGLILYLDAANPKSYISGNTTCNDLSNNQLIGTISGCTYSGNSLYFNGVNDYINISSSIPIIESLSAETISMWFKITLNNQNPSCLLHYGDGGGTNRALIYLGNSTGTYSDESINISSFGTMEFSIRKGHTYYYDNIWHNIVYTTNSLGNLVYIDGILQSVTYSVGNATVNAIFKNGVSNLRFNIGRRDIGSTTLNTNMNFGNIQIYNRALSQQEITQNYNATKSRFNL